MSTAISEATELPVGHAFTIDFGVFTPQVTFVSETQLRFDVLDGMAKGMSETVDYEVTNLRPGLFIVSWQEESKTSVVHVEDFANGQVHANITQPDGTVMRLTGAIGEAPGN